MVYWMGGVNDPFTGFGKLEIEKIHVDIFSDSWNVTVNIRNVGTKTTVVDYLTVKAETISHRFEVQLSIGGG